jgi:hypothetical protein
MVPKSLPHQTLAKLFSETDRLFLFFSFSINSTESIIAERGYLVKRLSTKFQNVFECQKVNLRPDTHLTSVANLETICSILATLA